MKRLFVSLLISDAGKEPLIAAQQALAAVGTGRFIPRENLHLTLAFLGRTDREAQAAACLRAVAASHRAFPYTLETLGRFGDVLWAGTRKNPALQALGEDMQSALRAEGFFLEERPFLPHVTLARGWVGEETALALTPCPLRADRVVLFSSEQESGRIRYRVLCSADLS